MMWTPAGAAACMASDTLPLTEPTSETVAPAFRCGAMVAMTSATASTGVAKITRSACATALPRSASTASAIPSAVTRSSTVWLMSATVMWPAAL